jgi:hypothetical protein
MAFKRKVNKGTTKENVRRGYDSISHKNKIAKSSSSVKYARVKKISSLDSCLVIKNKNYSVSRNILETIKY